QVAAHLAAEQGADFLHLGLDHRMTGLPHHRTSAQLADQLRQAPGALDVEYDVRARVAGHYVLGKQHQQAVGTDDLAAGGDHAERGAADRCVGLAPGGREGALLVVVPVGVSWVAVSGWRVGPGAVTKAASHGAAWHQPSGPGGARPSPECPAWRRKTP